MTTEADNHTGDIGLHTPAQNHNFNVGHDTKMAVQCRSMFSISGSVERQYRTMHSLVTSKDVGVIAISDFLNIQLALFFRPIQGLIGLIPEYCVVKQEQVDV